MAYLPNKKFEKKNHKSLLLQVLYFVKTAHTRFATISLWETKKIPDFLIKNLCDFYICETTILWLQNTGFLGFVKKSASKNLL